VLNIRLLNSLIDTSQPGIFTPKSYV